ncbi:2-oxoglutaroyl-CoA hydrolase [Paraburkholderia sp. GAS199]|uniref:enoyl-CoA hydratase/isomerase family protein n=1 Tax=Paraburkholderia sp. GAS199 TaxID=3035126 RepID=UPI003D241DCB
MADDLTIANGFDGFRVEYRKGMFRADIVLDRPSFNLISMDQREHLLAVFDMLDSEPLVRVIVVRGVGDHFSAGSLNERLPQSAIDAMPTLARDMSAPARCGKPVIALNRGYCFDAGFELSLACDFRVATETTLYALRMQEMGQLLSQSGSARLQEMVGVGRAKDIIMRSRFIHGTEAYDWGIATDFVVDSELEKFTDDLVRELLALSPLAQRAMKAQLNEVADKKRQED